MSSSIAQNKEYAIRPVSLRWLSRTCSHLLVSVVLVIVYQYTILVAISTLSLFGVAMVTVYLSHWPGVTTEHIGKQK